MQFNSKINHNIHHNFILFNKYFASVQKISPLKKKNIEEISFMPSSNFIELFKFTKISYFIKKQFGFETIYKITNKKCSEFSCCIKTI